MINDSEQAADAAFAPTRPVKHSFTLAGHRTSISLEAAFWEELRAAAAELQISVSELVSRIDRARGDAGLSSAVRVWILQRLRDRLHADRPDAHARAAIEPGSSPRGAADG